MTDDWTLETKVLLPYEYFGEFATDLSEIRNGSTEQCVHKFRNGPHWKITKELEGVSIIFRA